MRTEVLKVSGMNSIDCIDTVTRVLTAVTGVTGVNVSLLRSEVEVSFDDRRAAPEQMEAALEKAGYDARAASAAAASGSCCGGCCS